MNTGRALAYAGIPAKSFADYTLRRVLTDLPAARRGRAGRAFEIDDLLAIGVFGDLLRIGVTASVAGVVFDRLRAQLRATPAVERLNLVIQNGAPALVATVPEGARLLWTLRIADYRRDAAEAIKAGGGACQ